MKKIKSFWKKDWELETKLINFSNALQRLKEAYTQKLISDEQTWLLIREPPQKNSLQILYHYGIMFVVRITDGPL